MKHIFSLLLICILSVASCVSSKPSKPFFKNQRQLQSSSPYIQSLFLGSGNGGSSLADNYNCIFCLMIVHAIEQYSNENNVSVDDFVLDDYCGLFDSSVESLCRASMLSNGPSFLRSLDASTNPDNVCRSLALCSNPECNLYPVTEAPVLLRKVRSPNNNNVNTPVQDPNPVMDADNDGFSTKVAENGGYFWKGRDCDSTDSQIYPGRKANPYTDRSIDYNCNGIYAYIPNTEVTYDASFCRDSTNLGIAVAGDSLGAHFELPVRWFNAADWKNPPQGNVASLILDNFDTPQFGAFTGTCPDPNVQPCRSLYTYLVDNNKCNFNDYQNIAVNGATMSSTISNIRRLLRNKNLDSPLLLVLELVRNDICSGNMTSPESFRQSLEEILAYLDTTLPNGSHLVIMGIPEQDNYAILKDDIHISGVTYTKFFDFQLCIGKQNNFACPNTQSSNDTIRNGAYQRARELNRVSRDILNNFTTTSFDSVYYAFPAQANFSSLGANLIDLISQVDGYHLNQLGHAFIADYLWNNLNTDHPQWIGAPNPHNGDIERIFQSQEAVIIRQSDGILIRPFSTWTVVCILVIHVFMSIH